MSELREKIIQILDEELTSECSGKYNAVNRIVRFLEPVTAGQAYMESMLFERGFDTVTFVQVANGKLKLFAYKDGKISPNRFRENIYDWDEVIPDYLILIEEKRYDDF